MIKLQEAPDMVPVGELPRHMMLHAERRVISTFLQALVLIVRYLTAKVIPGSRIIATGIYSTFAPSSKGVSIMSSYIGTPLTDRKTHREHPLCASHIYVYSVSSSTPRLLPHQDLGHSRQRRKRNSSNWLAVMGCTSGSRAVSRLVSLVIWVSAVCRADW